MCTNYQDQANMQPHHNQYPQQMPDAPKKEGFIKSIGSAFTHTFDYNGTATRAQYGWWILFATIIIILISFNTLSAITDNYNASNCDVNDPNYMSVEDENKRFLGIITFYSIFYIILLLPTLSITYRRLKAINMPSWLSFVQIFSYLSLPVLIVFAGTFSSSIVSIMLGTVPSLISLVCSIASFVVVIMCLRKGKRTQPLQMRAQ